MAPWKKPLLFVATPALVAQANRGPLTLGRLRKMKDASVEDQDPKAAAKPVDAAFSNREEAASTASTAAGSEDADRHDEMMKQLKDVIPGDFDEKSAELKDMMDKFHGHNAGIKDMMDHMQDMNHEDPTVREEAHRNFHKKTSEMLKSVTDDNPHMQQLMDQMHDITHPDPAVRQDAHEKMMDQMSKDHPHLADMMEHMKDLHHEDPEVQKQAHHNVHEKASSWMQHLAEKHPEMQEMLGGLADIMHPDEDKRKEAMDKLHETNPHMKSIMDMFGMGGGLGDLFGLGETSEEHARKMAKYMDYVKWLDNETDISDTQKDELAQQKFEELFGSMGEL